MVYKRYDTLYVAGQNSPFRVSRSKVELFIQCPRCFWLDRVAGVKRPETPAFLINTAVDTLLKREFDIYRASQKPHPWFADFGIRAVPYAHAEIDTWRHTFTGIQHTHRPTNFILFGAVDDIWVNDTGELHVVDYKATAKNKEIKALDAPGGWHDGYRRQMDFYQWLLRSNGFTVSDTGYFVYANGDDSQPGFHNKVTFQTCIFPYSGDTKWIEPVLQNMKDVLESPDMPQAALACEYCAYTGKRLKLAFDYLKKSKKV